MIKDSFQKHFKTVISNPKIKQQSTFLKGPETR
jgi:hypothetical protein